MWIFLFVNWTTFLNVTGLVEAPRGTNPDAVTRDFVFPSGQPRFDWDSDSTTVEGMWYFTLRPLAIHFMTCLTCSLSSLCKVVIPYLPHFKTVWYRYPKLIRWTLVGRVNMLFPMPALLVDLIPSEFVVLVYGIRCRMILRGKQSLHFEEQTEKSLLLKML